jgi:hypothetical protein
MHAVGAVRLREAVVVEAEIARVGHELGDVVAEGRLGVAVLHEVPPEPVNTIAPTRRARAARRSIRCDVPDCTSTTSSRVRSGEITCTMRRRVEQLVEGALLAGRAQQGHEALDARHEHHAQGPQGHAAGVGAETRRTKPALMLRDALNHGGGTLPPFGAAVQGRVVGRSGGGVRIDAPALSGA